MKTITARALKDLLDSSNPPKLVHVLPEEVFKARRIAGSCAACVYEMVFLEGVQKVAPDLSTALVVYGSGSPSLDSAAAAEKLAAAGYTDVRDFRGGLTEWEAEGFPIESDGPFVPPLAPQGKFAINTETSIVRWTGRNLFNHHNGTVKLAGGNLVIQNGKLVSATFTLDMNAMANEDLTDAQWNAMLIQHLRSEDFFAVDRFPTATFVSESATLVESAAPGTPNYEVSGELTLRGVTRPLTFQAVIAAADEAHITGQAQFEIDRTEFGSQYGSGKLFAFLGKHIVNDHIHLHVKINAERSAD